MKTPEFVLTKDTQQLFDLRREKVMQIDEIENSVSFCRSSTLQTVYGDEEKIIIPASRFFRALQKIQNYQIEFFTRL